jgi:hypothetical protein
VPPRPEAYDRLQGLLALYAGLATYVVAHLVSTAARRSGAQEQLASVADGRVWFGPERDPQARIAWRGGDGQFRHLGEPPAGVVVSSPTLEDGYLWLVGDSEAAAA